MFASCPLYPQKRTLIERVGMSALCQKRVRRPLNDDVSPSAGDYGLDLRLLGLRHGKLVKCLLEIVEKCLLLCRCYHEMLVRFFHGATGVLLRPAGGPADHFRDEILKACRGNAMMGLVYLWVRI